MVHVTSADSALASAPADDLPASRPPAPPPESSADGPEPQWTRRGSGAYWRITVGLFLVGYATFSLIYCVQPLLPILAEAFGVSPAQSSLSLSVTTACLAVSILCFGALSENLGRKWLMFASMGTASVLTAVSAFLPDWTLLLITRAAIGVALGGVPAVAMAYLAEEIEPKGLGLAMGVYISGNAFGGMAGRVITGYVAEHFSWPTAVAFIGATGIVSVLCFALLLPESRNFARKRRFSLADHLGKWKRHLANPRLAALFAVGFLTMGAFVTVYNYVGFRLLAAPFSLSHGEIALIFTCYMFGIVSSSAAGWLSDRVGRGPVLTGGMVVALAGLALTLTASLTAIVAGIATLTVGFFAAHSTASSWIGQTAQGAKGHASSLYLLAYYVGSSVLGSTGGWMWSTGGWPRVAALCGAAWALTAVLAVGLQVSARRIR
ncbi:putative transporter; MFS type [uncultured Alphaproteobacteria bacterium]|uniref:Putative transporter MFS type n=1 Tax=uncultured Alphaproteobacteria bacterium TaxID=91750 RepID=A0A212KCW3_9PROT|nr:putative transporter; MFS type [uncultured Alphaproteobacteria bacterium]